MSKMLQTLGVAVLVMLVLVSSSFGQRQRGQGGPRGQRNPFQLPRQIELNDEQKTKIADLQKKFEEKLKAAQEKAKLTDDQNKARREAMQKARQDGKQGEELRKAVQEAVTLTDDQKKGQEELTAITKEITTAIEGVLTDEQKAKLKELREQRPGRRGAPRNAA